MNTVELNQHILENIQGVFGVGDMNVLKEEIEKLKPGEVYLEVGVDEGRSFTTAYHYAKKGVYVVGVDIADIPPHEKSVGRGTFAVQEGQIGIGKRGIFIHGDADEVAPLWTKPISLLFLDPHHDYESIKNNALSWLPKVKKGGVVLYHDIDHPETLQWVNDHHGKNWEALHGKIGRVHV